MANYESINSKDECVFCNIVSGNIKTPGIFWEDDHYMAFLSTFPSTEGFSVVIPKEHYDSDVMEMPEFELQKFVSASQKVAKILKESFEDVGRIGVVMEGLGINHAHVKLFPMHGTPELKNGGFKQYQSDQVFWFDDFQGWFASGDGPQADPEKLRELAEKIKQSYQK